MVVKIALLRFDPTGGATFEKLYRTLSRTSALKCISLVNVIPTIKLTFITLHRHPTKKMQKRSKYVPDLKALCKNDGPTNADKKPKETFSFLLLFEYLQTLECRIVWFVEAY